MSQPVDLLVCHAHLLTMTGAGAGYLSDGALAAVDDAIVDVGPFSALAARYQARERIDATNCAVLPGLIDAHLHPPQGVLRGVAQDVSHWRLAALAPFARHMDDRSRLAGTQVALFEGLKAGTTSFRPRPTRKTVIAD